jgi:deoxyhypusine monooxygenase
MWTVPPLEELVTTLENPEAPIGMRMRAAYFVKQIFNNEKDDSNKASESILKVLSSQVQNEAHGSLLRHEFAYVLGQLQTPKACSILEKVLLDPKDCVMVRHEAAEALGAIASSSSAAVLEKMYSQNTGKVDELADTCKLALTRIIQQQNPDSDNAPAVGCACMLAPFSSVDPVDADPKHKDFSTHDLGDLLLNESENLIERYRAMFSLRNRGGNEAVLELCRALVDDKSSPLLRHEVAFVLGQLQHPSSIHALETSLANVNEHVMVRHESAEALGAIDVTSSEEWEQIENTLKRYQTDPVQAVAESCFVALDAADYWGHSATTSDDDQMPTFGQQKNSPTTESEACEIRKHILDQHFNVQTAA